MENEKDLKKKLEYFANGDNVKELFGGIFVPELVECRGYVEVYQYDSQQIKSGFTTFSEFIEMGKMFNSFKMFFPYEYKFLKPALGTYLFKVSNNGIMDFVDCNPDSSD